MEAFYILEMRNESKISQRMCVFLTIENESEVFFTPIWRSKLCHPGTKTRFEWRKEYCFTWAQTGKLDFEKKFISSQDLPCDSAKANATGFTFENGAYKFTEKGKKERPSGELAVYTDNTIPSDQTSVGIGMHAVIEGKDQYRPFCACQATPNYAHVFKLSIQYWVTFGGYETGQVVKPSSVNQPKEIIFPPNVWTQSATLNENNEWMIGGLVVDGQKSPQKIF